MKFFYNMFITLAINLPLIWLCAVFNEIGLFSLFLPACTVVLILCGVGTCEGILFAIFLGLIVDSLQTKTEMFGISALILSAAVVLLRGKAWRNVLRYGTYSWSFLLNIILQTLYVCAQLLWYNLSLFYLKQYIVSILLSAVLAAFLIRYLLKLQSKYLI